MDQKIAGEVVAAFDQLMRHVTVGLRSDGEQQNPPESGFDAKKAELQIILKVRPGVSADKSNRRSRFLSANRRTVNVRQNERAKSNTNVSCSAAARSDYGSTADRDRQPVAIEDAASAARDIIAKLMTNWHNRGLPPLVLAEAFVEAGLLQVTRERGPRAAVAIFQEFTGSGPRIDSADSSARADEAAE